MSVSAPLLRSSKIHLVNRFEDLVVRAEVNKVVNDLVNLDRVRSLLMTISQRRWFLATLEQKKASNRIDRATRGANDCCLLFHISPWI